MISLEHLSWDDAFSYGPGNSLDLLANKVTQIVGQNGHGKSSIALILEEVFYNKNSKGTKRAKVVNRYSKKKSCSFRARFSCDEDSYELVVTRSATQKVTLLKNGEDISAHTATATLQKVEDLLGMEFKVFSQLIYQNSRSSLSFLTDTDTNRKKFLIDMMSLERYVKIFEAIKMAHKDVESRVTQVKTEVATIESWLNKHKSQTLEEKNLVVVPEIPQFPEIDELSNTLTNITSINNKISQNNQYIALRDQIDARKLAETPAPKKSYDDLLRRKGELEAGIKTSAALLAKMQKLNTSECPTCLQAIDTSNKETIINQCNQDIEEARSHIEPLDTEIKRIQAENKAYDAHQALVNDFEKYSNLIDPHVERILRNKDEVATRLAKLKADLQAARKAAEAAIGHNNAASAHNSKVATIRDQITEFETNLATANIKLEEVNNLLAKLEVLKKAFSTNGLLAYKIENSVKDLEDLTNEYLSSMSDGRFQLLFKLNNDKLNVVIVDNGEEVEINDLSGGEMARVNTSALLALRKLMASISNNNINVLFLDETIDCLDADGKERLVEILLNETGLNTFIISHGYTHPLLAKITVVKSNKISKIED